MTTAVHVPKKPLTVIGPEGAITFEEMQDKVVKTREDHGQLLQDYHKVWYESGHTWVYTQFMGIGMMKCPNDLWAYHELIFLHRPTTIIETGTYQGGSALWFAFLMDMLNIDGGQVFTIDLENRQRCSHPRITFITGDSTDPAIASALRDEAVDGPLLITLDADHSEEHVRKELELYAPMCSVGDRLVVEDTNIAWVGPGGDRGARGGLEDYLLSHQGEFVQDVLCERWLLTMHPGGWLQRVAECSHG